MGGDSIAAENARLRRWAVALLAAAVMLASPCSRAQSFTLNLQNADIATLIATVSEVTGRNFIVDPRVQGKVTVVSARPLRDDEVYQVFLSVLKVHGFVAVPAGSVVKILPEAEGRTRASGSGSDEIVTRVIPVRNVPAETLVPVLRPLLPQFAHLAAQADSNALVISDTVGNVSRIEQVIRRMDVGANAEIEVVTLQHASAVDVANTITATQSGQAGGGAPRIVAEERTNSVLLSGDKSARQRLRQVVKRLDRPTRGSGNTQVLRLRFAKAEDLVPVLEGITDGTAMSRQGEGDGANLAKRTTILAEPAMNALIITTTPSHMATLKAVVAQLDLRRNQVLVEAIIADMSIDKAKQFGVQWRVPTDPNNTGPIGGTNFTGGGTAASLAALASNPLGVGAGLSLGIIDGLFEFNGQQFANFALLVRALASDASTNVLSTPSVVTVDNRPAEIVVAQNVPFITGQFTNAADSGATNPFQTIERQDVGIILRVRPQVNNGEELLLEIEQEVSRIAPATSVTTAAVDLVTNKRSLRTAVMVEDGKVLVLGGLMNDNVQQSREKVPVLGDVPLLGRLFSFDNTGLDKRSLMVFLRTTILKEGVGKRVTAERYEDTRIRQQERQAEGVNMMPEESSPVLPTVQGFLDQLQPNQPPETEGN